MRYAALLVLLALSANSQAQVSGDYTPMTDITSFRSGVTEIAKATNTIQSDFRQEKHLEILQNNIVSEGELFFKKPQSLKWAYKQPYRYIIVLDGKEVVVSDEGNVRAFDISSSEVFREVSDLIVNSVQGDIFDSDRFEIDYFENESSYLAVLMPKDDDLSKYVSEINVFFGSADYVVSKIRMNEPGGDYTLIRFSNKRMNEPIEADVFDIR